MSENIDTPQPRDPLADILTPEWFKHWRKHHSPDSFDPSPTWGFVVFRTALYADEPSWQAFKTQMTSTVNLSFALDRELEQARINEDPTSPPFPPDYDTIAANFELKWIEDPALADANAPTLRTRYNTLKPSLPAGQANPVFLVATTQVTTSLLSLPEDQRPTTKSKYWRRDAPTLLVVDADYDPTAQFDEELDSYMRVKPCFHAAAETVASQLWPTVNDDARPLWHWTLSVRAADEIDEVPGEVNEAAFLEDIWWSAGPTPASLRRRRRPWLDAGGAENENENENQNEDK